MKRPRHRTALYGTKQVSSMLGIPEWRVKNFSEGEAYGLPPAIRTGRGRGSRRLYELADIYRMLIANELVGCGFTPEAVGRAVREIRESELISRDSGDPDVRVLVLVRQKWSVINPEVLKDETVRNSLVVIPFQQLISDLHHDIEHRLERKFLQREYPEVFK
jgi:DNA-binding transcriptional MerR regulator